MAPHHDTPPSDEKGQKWVGLNHGPKQAAMARNGGTLPASPALVTSWYPNCDIWSEEQLPEILFYFVLPPSKYRDVPVEYMMENGRKIPDGKGGFIRYFEILPRRISLDVPGWLIEAWRRTDCRIKYSDILARQQEHLDFGGPGQHLKKSTANAMQNRCSRQCRKILGYWPDYNRRPVPHRAELECLENFAILNITYNTVLPVAHDDNSRLLRLKLVRTEKDGNYSLEAVQVGADDIMKNTFPLDYFTRDMPKIGMTPQMEAAHELLLVLNERAHLHGIEGWQELEKQCLPKSWYDRTESVRRAWRVPADGGCHICKWTEYEDPGYNTSDTETNEWKQKSNEKERRKARKASARMGSLEATTVEQGSVEANAVEQSSVEATFAEKVSVEANLVDPHPLEATSAEQGSVESILVEQGSLEAISAEQVSVDTTLLLDERSLPQEPYEPTADDGNFLGLNSLGLLSSRLASFRPVASVVASVVAPVEATSLGVSLGPTADEQASPGATGGEQVNTQSPQAISKKREKATKKKRNDIKIDPRLSAVASSSIIDQHAYKRADTYSPSAVWIPSRRHLTNPNSKPREQIVQVNHLSRSVAGRNVHQPLNAAGLLSSPDHSRQAPTASGSNEFLLSDLIDEGMLEYFEEVAPEDEETLPRATTPDPLPYEWVNN